MFSRCSTRKTLQFVKKAFVRVEKTISSAQEKISQSPSLQEQRELELFIFLQEQKIKQLELLKHFQVGEWVCRNNTKFLEAGEIIDIYLDKEDYPVIVVAYDLQDKPQQENPVCLRKCSAEELNYQWYEFKIVRKIDRYECGNAKVIEKFLTESELELTRANLVKASKGQLADYQKQVAYCKNRIFSLTSKLPSPLNSLPSEQMTLDFKGFEDTKESKISDKQLKMISRLYGNERGETKFKVIGISEIKCDPKCQQREALDLEVVEEYKQFLLDGGELPSVKVKFDGINYWLYDGFHTLQAFKDIGRDKISVDFTPGTLRDAILASCGVNASHGLRRSNQTKRNAVMTLLKDEEWKNWSDNEISKKCQVSQPFVSRLRKNLTYNVLSDKTEIQENLTEELASDKPEDNNTRKYINKHGTESTMNVKNIGKKDRSSNIILFPDTTKFKPKQLVELNLASLEGVSEELKLINHHYCQVDSEVEGANLYRIKSLKKSADKLHTVKAEDLTLVKQVAITFTTNYTPEEYLELIEEFGDRAMLEEIIYESISQAISNRRTKKKNGHQSRPIA